MIGEIITTGDTYDQGRVALNQAFSGSAQFAILSATTFYSGSTLLDLIIEGLAATYWSAGTGLNSLISYSGNTASGLNAIAIGNSTLASGDTSFAEGFFTIAGGASSHAEGNTCQALGVASHAEGSGSVASGQTSHAEGDTTQANGLDSHSGGRGTQANGDYSFVHARNSNANAESSAILGGSFNTIPSTSNNSIILGMTSFIATSADTTYMANSYIDGYLDLNPQSILPVGVTGRMFYSGGTFNKLMVYNGVTWEVITST